MEFLSEFAGMISKNLICQIMLGNFELPNKVPFLTLMVKNSLYKVIPTPIVSNFDENPVIKLACIEIFLCIMETESQKVMLILCPLKNKLLEKHL